MGSTSLGFPYPEGTDLVIEGDNAIRALAQALNDALKPAWGIADAAGSSGQSGVSSSTPASFATPSGTGEFTLESGTTIRYTGPNRWFMADFEVQANLAGSANSSGIATLVVNGSAVAGTARTGLLLSSGTGAPVQTLRITTPLVLSSGFSLQLLLSAATGTAGFTNKQFRIASMGPTGVSL